MTDQRGQNLSLEELQAEIDRLNSEIAARDAGNAGNAPTGAAPDSQTVKPTSGPGVFRETAGDAKVIGAAADPRGGSVIAYSDGTVKLFGVPAQGPDSTPADPWGTAPEGHNYVAFYTSDNGESYNFVDDAGTVVPINNPVATLPPGATPRTT